MSIVKIKSTKMPSLFLSGLMDQLIPPKMMTELYQVSMIVLNSRNVVFKMYLKPVYHE